MHSLHKRLGGSGRGGEGLRCPRGARPVPSDIPTGLSRTWQGGVAPFTALPWGMGRSFPASTLGQERPNPDRSPWAQCWGLSHQAG